MEIGKTPLISLLNIQLGSWTVIDSEMILYINCTFRGNDLMDESLAVLHALSGQTT